MGSGQAEWNDNSLQRRKIKADSLSATIWTDSSSGPPRVIIPLHCLNLYRRGGPVLQLSLLLYLTGT